MAMDKVVELKEMFDALDTDGSGTLERPELITLLQKMGEPEERVEELFLEADKDGDGKVDFKEFRKVRT